MEALPFHDDHLEEKSADTTKECNNDIKSEKERIDYEPIVIDNLVSMLDSLYAVKNNPILLVKLQNFKLLFFSKYGSKRSLATVYLSRYASLLLCYINSNHNSLENLHS